MDDLAKMMSEVINEFANVGLAQLPIRATDMPLIVERSTARMFHADIRAAAIDWILSCEEESDLLDWACVSELSEVRDTQLKALIAKNYDGGFNQFVKDSI